MSLLRCFTDVILIPMWKYGDELYVQLLRSSHSL